MQDSTAHSGKRCRRFARCRPCGKQLPGEDPAAHFASPRPVADIRGTADAARAGCQRIHTCKTPGDSQRSQTRRWGSPRSSCDHCPSTSNVRQFLWVMHPPGKLLVSISSMTPGWSPARSTQECSHALQSAIRPEIGLEGGGQIGAPIRDWLQASEEEAEQRRLFDEAQPSPRRARRPGNPLAGCGAESGWHRRDRPVLLEA